MSAKPVRVEIIVLVLLGSMKWPSPSPSNPGHNCHLENSNVVQRVIHKKLLPILERYKSSLPIDCPFHASRDLYGRRREGPELEGNRPGAVCWICGLAFANTKQLRHHYQTEHAESLALHEGAVCLADYCAIMRCNVFAANEWLTSLNISRTQQQQPQQQQQQQHSGDETHQQRPDKEQLHAKHQHQHQLQAADDKELAAAGRLAARESLRAREEARRGACNATQLKEVQTKCQVIVRSCIANLLLSLSPKDFQEIEEDMNRAVCSFLTCERYWEDSLVEEPRYPLGFFAAVVTMLAIGMMICYYIVWVVFETHVF